MLDDDRIAEVVAHVADGQLPNVQIRRVLSQPTINSVGGDALRITLVLEPDDVAKLTGDQAIDFLVAVHRSLETEGEHRNPIVEYASEQDLLIEEQ